MHARRLPIVITLIVTTALAPIAVARAQHVVDPAALAAAVAEHAVQQADNRAAIREALERPEVRELAAKAGVGIERLVDSVAALDGAELEQAAAAARTINDQLAGGQSTLTISTTTIIIALLVVILLIVAID